MKTGSNNRTPLYGRPFKCKECGSPEVTLFAIEFQPELDEIQRGLSPRTLRRQRTISIALDVSFQ